MYFERLAHLQKGREEEGRLPHDATRVLLNLPVLPDVDHRAALAPATEQQIP